MGIFILKKLINEAFNFVNNNFKYHEKDKIKEFFNEQASNFSKKARIPFHPYCKLTLLPNQNKMPLKRVSKNDDIRLYVRDLIYFDTEKMGVILKYEILIQLLKQNFNEDVASDCSFAIIWDIESNKSLKKWIYKIWIEMHPRKYITPFRTYFLAGYVSVVTKTKKYSDLFFSKYSLVGNKKLSRYFPIQIAVLNLSDFSKTDLKILQAIIHNNTRDLKTIIKLTSFSISTVSLSINKLLNTYMLIERTKPYPTGLGFISVIGLIKTTRGNGELFYKFNYPLTKLITIFRGTEDLVFINYYIPDTYYSKGRFIEWYLDALKGRNGNITIEVKDIPLFGFELENERVYIQRPELFDKSINEWKIGEEAYEYSLDNGYDPIDLSKNQRTIALQIFNGTQTKKELYKKVGKNHNKFLKDFDQIEKSRIFSKEYVIPFYLDLIRVLVIYDARFKNKFLKKVASIVPLSINKIFEIPSKLEFTYCSKLVGYSFMNVPHKYLLEIQKIVLEVDRKAIFAMFPQNLSSRSELNAKPTDDGWIYQKIPPVAFNVVKNIKLNFSFRY